MQTQQTRILLFALVAVLIVALTGCATNRPASEQFDDATITGKVKSKLAADPEINPFNIDVDTLEGVVTLRGEVEKPVARTEAIKLAKGVKGVKRVVDHIRVVSSMEEDNDRVDDARIGAEVKAKITADSDLNPLNIDVDVEDGVVTLSGIVATSARRAKAEQLAKSVSGVVRVHNELKVKG